MTVPSVSVVVMNHNYGRFVAEALRGAVSQNRAAEYREASRRQHAAVADDGAL